MHIRHDYKKPHPLIPLLWRGTVLQCKSKLYNYHIIFCKNPNMKFISSFRFCVLASPPFGRVWVGYTISSFVKILTWSSFRTFGSVRRQVLPLGEDLGGALLLHHIYIRHYHYTFKTSFIMQYGYLMKNIPLALIDKFCISRQFQ